MSKPAVHNFNSGPSVLPKEVFEQASQAVLNFNDTGLSILELGHRTPLFQTVLDDAIATAIGSRIRAEGFLTKTDALPNSWLAMNFAKCDADQNGKVTEAEYTKCQKM